MQTPAPMSTGSSQACSGRLRAPPWRVRSLPRRSRRAARTAGGARCAAGDRAAAIVPSAPRPARTCGRGVTIARAATLGAARGPGGRGAHSGGVRDGVDHDLTRSSGSGGGGSTTAASADKSAGSAGAGAQAAAPSPEAAAESANGSHLDTPPSEAAGVPQFTEGARMLPGSSRRQRITCLVRAIRPRRHRRSGMPPRPAKPPQRHRRQA